MDGLQVSREKAVRQERWMVCSPLDFIVYADANPWRIYDLIPALDGTLYLWCNTAGTPLYAGAPVHLPHGAVITELAVDAYTGDGINDEVTVTLLRQEWFTSNQVNMASVSHINQNSRLVLTDTTITNPVLDMMNYYYWLHVKVYATITNNKAQLWAARLKWE